MSEAAEHVAAVTAELVRLEDASHGRAVTPPDVAELFRHVHSLKGMAASLELDGIAAIAHRAEDLVGAFRERPPDPAAIDVLLATADAITAMLEDVRAGRSPDADPVLLGRLAAALKPPDAREEPAAVVRGVIVTVAISDGCLVPGVRAFLVLKKLERLGEAVSVRPALEQIRAGQLPGRTVEVTLATSAPLSTVEAALEQISDLASVSVRDAEAPVRVERGPRREPSARPPPPAVADARTESTRTVRVRAELLDTFLESVGELIVATARIREIGRGLPEVHRPVLEEGVDHLNATVQHVHDQVMAVRMTPIAAVTGRLARAVRDVARRTGKQVELEVRGADIEIDRAVVDELADPLLHVIRNAVGHGIEEPDTRHRLGKPETGRVTVTARRERERVVVEVADDGMGMEPERLRQAAVASGAVTAEEARAADDHAALMLACLPGVSTAEELTDIAGRGVGMDAVQRTVEALGGALDVESVPGQGTRWIFLLPLTVAVQSVLLVKVGDEVLGIPVSKVRGAVQVGLATGKASGRPERREVEAREDLVVDGRPVPLRDLGELLGFGRAAESALASIVVAEEQGTRVGLIVDALLGQHDVVLKPLLRPLDQVPGLSAVTVLANGRPLFVLDVLRLAG